MANYTLRFANRSHSIQDWMIYRFDSFQLNPDYVRSANVTIHNDYTYNIVVSTDGGYAHVDLNYNATTQVWSIQSHTPNEWEIAQGNGIVTLRCLLEDQDLDEKKPDYNTINIIDRYNWSAVHKIKPPLQTAPDDVIFSGHGSFEFNGETAVPLGVEFWVLAPLGASIADSLGQSLENMDRIEKLGLKNPGSNDLINITPTIYESGSTVPNYILHAPRGIIIRPGGPHIIGVETPTPLENLWARLDPFIKEDETIRVFWAACTAIRGAKNQVVLGK